MFGRDTQYGFRMRGCVFLGCFLMFAGCATKSGPLAVLPVTSPMAAQYNLEGISSYNSGQWMDAKTHFESAIQADPTLPEAHFNLALTAHTLGLHEQAKEHFQIAGELDPDNKDIVDTSIYRHHLGLSSTFERHLSGGYRYQ